MVVARSSREVFDYVPLQDRKLPAEQQTVFHLRRFPTNLSFRAADLAATGGGKVGELALRLGIAGWTNFADKDGQQIECKIEKKVKVHGIDLDEAVCKESLEWLSQDLCTELLDVIRTGNTLSDDDVKN